MNGGLFMQTLKQDTKNKIRLEAKRAFLASGYRKASMRAIAEASGITAGNIYRYYENKEALFSSVIRDAYDAVIHIIDAHQSSAIDFQKTEYDQPAFNISADPVLNSIVDVFIAYRQEIHLLMNLSDGSGFENIRNELGVMVADKIRNEIFAAQSSGALDLGILSSTLGNACIDGISSVCNSEMSDEKLHGNIYGLILYLFQGAHTRISIMEKKAEGDMNE
jgi:AcrR family transcriptional regulator